MLNPDAETAFLSFSLPDALAASLSNLESIIVRSSLVSARFTEHPLDLRKIADAAQVDLVLSGTFLRVADQVRVSVELADAIAGTVMWSHTEQAALGDLFKMQDRLVERIIRLLELRLTVREQERLRRDAPSHAKAYEFYLRANQIAHSARGYANPQTWHIARDLYLQSVADDAGFAPAWAALGRVYRMMAKYIGEDAGANFQRAESAISKALDLNPDQPTAHMLLAQLETDVGRGREAIVRLLMRARLSQRDPEPFAGLCYACRYCGLLDESLAADRRARELDGALVTSVVHTHFVLGNDARVVELLERAPGGYGYVGLVALARLGRADAALEAAGRADRMAPASFRAFIGSVSALIEGRCAESARGGDRRGRARNTRSRSAVLRRAPVRVPRRVEASTRGSCRRRAQRLLRSMARAARPMVRCDTRERGVRATPGRIPQGSRCRACGVPRGERRRNTQIYRSLDL